MTPWHLMRGRLLVYIDPREVWMGVSFSEDSYYVYVCPLPMLVIRWERKKSWGWS